jgi:hypothetical protein
MERIVLEEIFKMFIKEVHQENKTLFYNILSF